VLQLAKKNLLDRIDKFNQWDFTLTTEFAKLDFNIGSRSNDARVGVEGVEPVFSNDFVLAVGEFKVVGKKTYSIKWKKNQFQLINLH